MTARYWKPVQKRIEEVKKLLAESMLLWLGKALPKPVNSEGSRPSESAQAGGVRHGSFCSQGLVQNRFDGRVCLPGLSGSLSW